MLHILPLLLAAAPAAVPPAAQALPQDADPHYRIDRFTPPDGEFLEVGGMDFASDGTLYVSTRRGRVWRIEDALADDPAAARFSIFAEGLQEGLGLKVIDDVVHVAQRCEVSRLLDLDGDGTCDRIETLSQGWGMSGNYHEFAFGLPRDAAGNLYVSTNVGFWSPEWWHGLAKVPWRGWILRVAPDGTTTPLAAGARSPCGLGFNVDGTLLYTDNQGDWMPACGIFPVEEGGFFGHPASLRWTAGYGDGAVVPSSTEPPDVARTPAAVWLPYAWSRSTGNLEAAPADGFGPFGGQLFVAELTEGSVLRARLEQVDGVWQGVCFPFREGVGSVCRVRFAPDGSLFTGFTNRGWGGLAPGAGLARIRWTGAEPLEMVDVRIEEDGFTVEFTAPLAEGAAPQVTLRAYDYSWWWDYGSPEQHAHEVAVEAAELSADRRTLRLRAPALAPGWCVRGRVAGVGLRQEEFAYTVNRMPGHPAPAAPIAKRAAPPAAKADDEAGWLMMTWKDPFDAWTATGWELADVALAADDRRKIVATPGNGALWNPGGRAQGFTSHEEFGDVAFRFRFMLPQGGDSGLYLMDRYELQLVDDAGWCGGVVGVKSPRVRAYNGPGIWHEMQGRFYAPRFDAQGRKTANARFEALAIDGVQVLGAAECEGPTGGAGLPGEAARGPLRFQGGAGLVALADVRVKPLDGGGAAGAGGAEAGVTDAGAAPAWRELFPDGLPEGAVQELAAAAGAVPLDFELDCELSIADGGAAVLLFRDDGQGNGYAVRIDSTGPGDARTGTLVGLDEVRTQFVPAGVPFRLTVRSERAGPEVHLRCWINGAEVSSAEHAAPPPPGGLRFLALTPDAGLRVRAARIREL